MNFRVCTIAAFQVAKYVCHCRADESTLVTYGGIVGVGGQHHTLVQDGGRSVCHATVTLHFAPSQATAVGSTVYGLTCESDHFAARTRVYFVGDHVFQTLIESGPNKHATFQTFASEWVVHDFLSVFSKTCALQHLANFVDRLVGKGSGVNTYTQQCGQFGRHAFKDVTNRHAARNGMWIDNNIGHDSRFCKREVFLCVHHANCAFLTMTLL